MSAFEIVKQRQIEQRSPRLLSLLLRRVCRLGLACLIVIPTGCDVPPEPLDWPSFDKEVIEVGRRVLRAQQDEQIGAYTPPPTDSGATETARDEAPSATREAVLKNIKVSVDVRGRRGQRAIEAIQALGFNAVDPLIEILADDSHRRVYAERAVSMLLLLISEPKGRPDGTRSTVPPSSANSIFDAVVGYVQRYPETRVSLGGLREIMRREQIPRVIELIESSSGDRQGSYISLFNAQAYTSFPTAQQGFCGNISPASIDRAVKDGEERQRESVGAIRAWWAAHKNESSDVWLAASLRGYIRKRTEYLTALDVTNLDDEDQQWGKTYAIREYYSPHTGIWRSSVFEMLVKEFDKAPWYMRPYVLRMIASTKHPDAVSFIASKLENADRHLQHAAVAALRDLKVSDHNEAIARILRSTKDKELRVEAIDALEELAKSEAIEDFIWALDHPEYPVSNRAKRVLEPYLVSHADQLRMLAQSHPNKEVRRRLGVMLDCAAASAPSKSDTEETSLEERLASTRALLRSDDPERQMFGISLVARNQLAELLPDVLELIQSPDHNVRQAAVNVIWEMGVPELTIETAPRVMGHSVMLDRHVAAYCYAKYGRKATPLMMKAAFKLVDPVQRSPKHVPKPAVGLVRALMQEEIAGMKEAVIRLVKNSRTGARYIQLLGMLDDSISASLVGEFLHHDDPAFQIAAIHVVRARHLRQHADQLFALASLTFDQGEIDRLRGELEEGKLTAQECNKQTGPIFARPQTQHAAMLALIDLEDPRAWQAVVTCLEGEHLDWRKRSGLFAGPRIVTNFGAAISRLKTSHRDDIHARLRKELQGENRERVVVSLTTALCIDPEAADFEVFRTVATTPQAHEKARILAAIALSKLGDRGIIPVLHELVRSFIAPNPERKAPRFYPFNWSDMLTASRQWPLHSQRPSPLDYRIRGQFPLPGLEFHHVDLGLALRRLGDETLVDELVEALSGIRGDFGWLAYRFLAGIVGLRAHDYALQWKESQEIESPHFLSESARALAGLDVPFRELLPFLVDADGMSVAGLGVLIAGDSKEAADALEKAYRDLAGYRHRYKLQILDALCRLGDARGIALAAKNPLLLASVVRYLPDAHGVDFPAGHFDYNRIEEAIRVQAWYERNAGDLRWDPESSQFRLANRAPNGPGTIESNN